MNLFPYNPLPEFNPRRKIEEDIPEDEPEDEEEWEEEFEMDFPELNELDSLDELLFDDDNWYPE